MESWTIDGFQSVVALWFWVGLVLIGSAWRSLQGPETDPIRPAGPPG